MPVTITTRAAKGSALTYDEADANFTALKTAVDLVEGAKGDPGPTRFYAFDDMVSNAGDMNWTVTNTGAGSGQSSAAEPTGGGGLGWLSFGLGTTATGRSARHTTGTAINFSNGVATYSCYGQIGALSSGTETYTARWGFHDSQSAESVDGVFFRYTDGVNSGKFQAVTRANNVETAADTGITAATGTGYKLTITVSASVPQAVFAINGTTVATITTNIPTTSARTVGAGIMGLKSLGITATAYWIGDYQLLEQILLTRA